MSYEVQKIGIIIRSESDHYSWRHEDCIIHVFVTGSVGGRSQLHCLSVCCRWINDWQTLVVLPSRSHASSHAITHFGFGHSFFLTVNYSKSFCWTFTAFQKGPSFENNRLDSVLVLKIEDTALFNFCIPIKKVYEMYGKLPLLQKNVYFTVFTNYVIAVANSRH